MVGLSDIPCVGQIVNRISDATVDSLFRGFNYMFCYKDYVNVLNSEIEKINTEEVRVSTKAVAARADGKIIYDHVLKWQAEAKEIQECAKEFLERYKNRSSWRCIQCLPIPKPVSRFQLGREAVHRTKRVTELSDSAKNLLANDVAYHPPVENLPTTTTVFQDFESRKDAYEKLWEALVMEDGPLILGIYGMPGVGKTRMMEHIWQEAKEKKIFEKVARADVGSDNLDVIKLQNQIAGHLDCQFQSQDDMLHRANQLKYSLKNGGKILIILDDAWGYIPLVDIIGTSFADGSISNGSKILVTSREKYVCLDNNCKHPVEITTLTTVEAWDLFKYTVGTDKIDSLQDESLLHEVCKRCAGLPLLIHAVGKALKCRPHHSWKDALYQLEKGKVERIAGIDPQVYACVKMSIDRLPDDAKSCLFLCSLYPEDEVIYVKELFQLATGTQLVPDGESRVFTVVDMLRSSSLLLDCKEDHKIKLHDLIRDVARSIAVRDPKYAFSIVRCGSQLPDDADYCTRKFLHLHLEKNDFRFPDDLVYPNLHSLWLQWNNHRLLSHKHRQQFSGSFSGMFANLRFLWIQGMFFSSELKFSLQPLGKLTTLILHNCNMTHISQRDVSFFPKNLLTLCIWDCDLPVPLGLPNLKDLRKLEILERRSKNVVMVPNTISNMLNLEELHVLYGLNIREDGFEINPAVEIAKLTELKSLQMLFVRDSFRFGGKNIFGNLLEYHIQVGDKLWYSDRLLQSSACIKRSIKLHGGNRLALEGLNGLIERAEVVKLDCADINMGSIYSSKKEAFEDLRNLDIRNCDTMEYLTRISHDDEIQNRRSFYKLTSLEIRECSAMKYLFSNSVAKCLVQLQELRIRGCPEMEAIVMNEGTGNGDENDIINFSKLKFLELSCLPRLKSFYREKKEMHSISTPFIMDAPAIHLDQAQPLFDEKVAFPSLEYMHINKLEDINDIWGKYEYNSSTFCKLRTLYIAECAKMKAVFPLSMLNMLHNLEDLKIWDCNRLRNVFQHSYIARHLIHLQKLQVIGCDMMRELIGEGKQQQEVTGDNDCIIVFPQLKRLELYAPNLSSIRCYQGGKADIYEVQLPNLVDLTLYGCGDFSLEDIGLGGDDFTCQLKSLCVGCDKDIQLPYKWLCRLYNLEELTLQHCWPHELQSPCFQRLLVLKVHNSGCSTLFTFSAFTSLQVLQELEISNSDILEEIVEDVRGDEAFSLDKETITLLQLRSVILRDLPNLKNFFHGANFECHIPALEKVKVKNCGLSTLFTCSLFGKLQQLEKLKVSNCELLGGIVEDVRDDDDVNNKTITLPQLSSLGLRDLPNLKSFSSTSRYVFDMPKLGRLSLLRCPQIDNFTFLKTSTALVCVYIERHQWDFFPDLNDYIRQERKRVISSSDSAGESRFGNRIRET